MKKTDREMKAGNQIKDRRKKETHTLLEERRHPSTVFRMEHLRVCLIAKQLKLPSPVEKLRSNHAKSYKELFLPESTE